MVPMDSFYKTIFYPVTYIILFPSSGNHNPSCIGFRVDMVSCLRNHFLISLL